MIHRPVDCLDHVARRSVSLSVEHFKVHEVRPGRHAVSFLLPVGPGRGDDAGHVRAVPVEILAAPRGVGEVDSRHDAPAQFRDVGNTRIDDRNAHALASDTGQLARALPHLVRAGGGDGDGHLGVQPMIAGELVEVGVARHAVKFPGGNHQDGAGAEPLLNAQPMPRGQRVNARLRGGHDDRGLGRIPVAQPFGQVVREAGAVPLRSGVKRRHKQGEQGRHREDVPMGTTRTGGCRSSKGHHGVQPICMRLVASGPNSKGRCRCRRGEGL